jgi:hypothetical protein
MSPVLDWWILPHVSFFLFLASVIHSKWEPKWWVHLILWLSMSYMWEGAEYFLQRRFVDAWVVVECDLNAWLIDPLSNGVGWLAGALIGRWSKGRHV